MTNSFHCYFCEDSPKPENYPCAVCGATTSAIPHKTAPPAEEFPQPRRVGEDPCGECHIQPGETCDICGASNSPVQPAGGERVARAIEICDWSGCSIGQKEILRAAIAELREKGASHERLQALDTENNRLFILATKRGADNMALTDELEALEAEIERLQARLQVAERLVERAQDIIAHSQHNWHVDARSALAQEG